MPSASHSVLLPYAVKEVFALVEDVERYAEFLPWCERSEILERGCAVVVASLQVTVAGRMEEVVTRNLSHKRERIELNLVSGPFRSFEGSWRFVDLGEGCRVSLDLSFELSNRLLSVLAGRLKDVAIERVIDAFADRARKVLG